MHGRNKKETGWVIWFVGLPGAGKSTYAQAVYHALQEQGIDAHYLSMDEKRKDYSPTHRYTPEERDKAYHLFAEEAARIANQGTNVIMDGTAPRLSMREYARRLVPHFAEIYIRCPLQTAIYREESRPESQVLANLYRKALERKRTGAHTEGLGEVIGVDTPFEENPTVECVIDSDGVSIEKGRDQVLDFLATCGRE